MLNEILNSFGGVLYAHSIGCRFKGFMVKCCERVFVNSRLTSPSFWYRHQSPDDNNTGPRRPRMLFPALATRSHHTCPQHLLIFNGIICTNNNIICQTTLYPSWTTKGIMNEINRNSFWKGFTFSIMNTCAQMDFAFMPTGEVIEEYPLLNQQRGPSAASDFWPGGVDSSNGGKAATCLPHWVEVFHVFVFEQHVSYLHNMWFLCLNGLNIGQYACKYAIEYSDLCKNLKYSPFHWMLMEKGSNPIPASVSCHWYWYLIFLSNLST